MHPLQKHLPVLLAAALVAGVTTADAQSLYMSWPLLTDHPSSLGQAQSGRVTATENDAGLVLLLDASGNLVAPGFHIATFARMVESTDDSLFVIAGGWPSLNKYTRSGTLARSYFMGSPSDIPRHLVPLDDGRVLLAFSNADPAKVLRIYDRNCNPAGNIPASLYEGHTGTVIGLTRCPDGSIVTCVSTFLGNYHLTSYDVSGAVRWDVPVPAGGAVAADSRGALYVCHGAHATSLDIYGSDGAVAGSWSGPAGQPLVNVLDIASSRAGDLLYALTYAFNGPVKVFHDLPVPAARASWGQVKTAQR